MTVSARSNTETPTDTVSLLTDTDMEYVRYLAAKGFGIEDIEVKIGRTNLSTYDRISIRSEVLYRKALAAESTAPARSTGAGLTSGR